MAYIAPNSTVEFFGDIGLSPNYENTLYFDSVQAKDNYFNGLQKITTATALSYNRAERGFFKVEKPMSQLINAGYIRFKNTSFEDKWFYAFVKNVEYVNNITTQVNFELDVMMTWMGAFALGMCFIERQHTLGDGIGANICYENLSLGEYVCEGSSQTAFFSEYRIAVYRAMSQSDASSITAEIAMKQGTCVPLYVTYYVYSLEGVRSMLSDLQTLVTANRGDEIVAIKLVPYRWGYSENIIQDNFTVDKPYNGSSAWGDFVPHNNKLYCFPYKYLRVENCEGKEVDYKYEYFNVLPDAVDTENLMSWFKIIGTSCTPETEVMCYPVNYEGVGDNISKAITMQDFPTIAWNIDGYKAYIAQRDSTLFSNIIASATISGTAGAITGGPIGAAIGAGAGVLYGSKQLLSDNAKKILDILSNGELPATAPSQTKGTLSSNMLVQSRLKNFIFKKMCITKNYAMMIDNYFDMYGYAIRQHGVPNMNARPNWTYVKTIGCVVHGNLPSDDGAKIEDIFDNGVRFWKNHINIGNYSLNNAPA